MNERMIRALLAVMNADPNKPEGYEWFAEVQPVSPWSTERGVSLRLQFWLISDVYTVEQAGVVEELISQ